MPTEQKEREVTDWLPLIFYQFMEFNPLNTEL